MAGRTCLTNRNFVEEELESMIHTDPRTRDSIWMGVSLALSCLADPRVLDVVSPKPGEDFDPREFLTSNGTLYLLATGAGAGAAWSLVAAFIEDLAETARHLARANANRPPRPDGWPGWRRRRRPRRARASS